MQAADRSPKKTLEPRDSRDVEPTSDPAMEPEGGGLLERRQESVMGGASLPTWEPECPLEALFM